MGKKNIMYKVKFFHTDSPSATLFKFFRNKEEADMFIVELGDRFISIELV